MLHVDDVVLLVAKRLSGFTHFVILKHDNEADKYYLETRIPFMETRHTVRTPCASSRGGGGFGG
jgi:hypothetical protein